MALDLLTGQNLNPYTRMFTHEKLKTSVAVIDAIISEIEKYPKIVFDFDRFRIYDNATYIHSVNVAFLTALIAQEMGYCGNGLREIALGAILHDLGKLNVPKNILNKPAMLTGDEQDLVKKHPEEGMKILEKLYLSVNIRMPIIQHHERWEGRGYPLGLKAEEIHPNAQIVAVADVFDALISDRPYRRGIVANQAIEMIRTGKGKDFSPRVVDQFIKSLEFGKKI